MGGEEGRGARKGLRNEVKGGSKKRKTLTQCRSGNLGGEKRNWKETLEQ